MDTPHLNLALCDHIASMLSSSRGKASGHKEGDMVGALTVVDCPSWRSTLHTLVASLTVLRWLVKVLFALYLEHEILISFLSAVCCRVELPCFDCGLVLSDVDCRSKSDRVGWLMGGIFKKFDPSISSPSK